jgi:6-pyruvoyltetrahydropterin/6-carboxytetrahydropterin synthase
VSLDGEPDPDTDLIFRFEELEAKLASLKDRLDHRLLNEVNGLETPTLERMAAWIWHELTQDLPGLAEVQISRPTCREGCIYTGPGKR